MLDSFKKFDVVDELDKNIKEEENIYVECEPHKFSFIFTRIKPYLLLIIFSIIIDFIYSLLRPNKGNNAVNFVDVIILCINVVSIIIVLKNILDAYSEALNTHYVITDRGIHMTKGGSSLIYQLLLYNDLKNMTLNKLSEKSETGNIYVKDIAEKQPKGLIKKVIYKRNGLIAIDQVDDVYDILKQIAIEGNPDIFFDDNNGIITNSDYLPDITKYSTKIKTNKSDSILDRRKH